MGGKPPGGEKIPSVRGVREDKEEDEDDSEEEES